MDTLPLPRRSALSVVENPPTSFVRVAAPMVRYSKLAFRNIVRRYGADIAYTPMIIAREFKNSAKARDAEFKTCIGKVCVWGTYAGWRKSLRWMHVLCIFVGSFSSELEDDPVVIQLAGCNAQDLADATELVAPYTSGVDLNCGCPKPNALSNQYGAWLLSRPQHIYDIVRSIKARVSSVTLLDGAPYPVSIKIRIHPNLKETVEMCQRAEKVGADWITVHGRTRKQRPSEPVDYEAIKTIKQSVGIPVFANGDVFSMTDARHVVEKTGTDGVMAARGLLRNPSMFSGTSTASEECLWAFVEEAVKRRTLFYILHHHVMYMLESMFSKSGMSDLFAGKRLANEYANDGLERMSFNSLTSFVSMLEWLERHVPRPVAAAG